MSCEILEERTGQRPKIRVLPPREATEEERASWAAYRRNKAYFLEHRERILNEHYGKDIVVFGDCEVRAFDKRSEKLAFRESLDRQIWEAAYLPHIRWRRQHVNSTGYLRVVRP